MSEITVISGTDGAWTFERPCDEVAPILSGAAMVETDDGRALTLGAGDVLVTPMGSSGIWRAREPVRKFWVVYHA